MTKEEFENHYCNNDPIELAKYHKTQITLECNCGQEMCCGWAAVSNNPKSIKAHKELYNRSVL